MQQFTGTPVTWDIVDDSHPAVVIGEPEQDLTGRTRIAIIALSPTSDHSRTYLRRTKVDFRFLARRDAEASPVAGLDDLSVEDLIAAQTKAQAEYRASNPDQPRLGSKIAAA